MFWNSSLAVLSLVVVIKCGYCAWCVCNCYKHYKKIHCLCASSSFCTVSVYNYETLSRRKFVFGSQVLHSKPRSQSQGWHCRDIKCAITAADFMLLMTSWPLIYSPPLHWTIKHLSFGDCLELKREYYQNCFVLDCVTQCSQSEAHLYEQFLQVKQIGFVTLGPLCHA